MDNQSALARPRGHAKLAVLDLRRATAIGVRMSRMRCIAFTARVITRLLFKLPSMLQNVRHVGMLTNAHRLWHSPMLLTS